MTFNYIVALEIVDLKKEKHLSSYLPLENKLKALKYSRGKEIEGGE